MFPLRDNIPSRTFPAVTLGVIAINVLVFFWEISLGRHVEDAFFQFGLVPIRYTLPELADRFNPVEQIVPFFSSMFLHGGWMHLIGNMWIFWIFGDNVEDRMGKLRFLVFYLLGGLAAAFLHILTNMGSKMPTIGASGAVAAVMGAYFRLFPHARVVTFIPPFFLGPLFVIPAVFFLAWWFLLQFFAGALSLGQQNDFGGIAWWAHIGGFLFGALLCTWMVHPTAKEAEMEY
jgi:membrane associated rhomboid family serine protease